MVIRNFLFHRVSDEEDALWPPMKPALFDRIIKHLLKYYLVVPLEDYLDNPASFKSSKYIATVLFDDGYKDNIEYAAPILHKYKCPASFYIVTDCINRNIPTWTYLVDNAFQQTSRASIEFGFPFVPEKLKTIFPGEKNTGSSLIKVKPWMKSLDNRERVQILNEILRQCNDVEIPVGKMMDWQDIKQLDTNGFVIGSHSHTHPILASLTDRKEIKEELDISFATIKLHINKDPLSISYPIGSFDERVKKIAEESGYKYGLAVKQEFFKMNEDNLFEIPRVELYQEAWWKSRIRISGFYSTAKKLWN